VILFSQLPRRRIASVSIRGELFLLFYEHGGFGKNDNVAVFRISADHAEPIWHPTSPMASRTPLHSRS
jgi:hypothetical protein